MLTHTGPDISFCIITDGRRPRKLADSIASIHAQRVPSYEIVIAGSPPEGVGKNIRQVLMKDAAAKADLGAMRNGAVEAARAPITVVADDDIIYDRDFFRAIREQINRFDLLSVSIQNPDGSRYWDWPEFEGPGGHRNIPYGVPSPFVYVTGGICVGWREKLLMVRWDEGRGINQGEDVDFSARFRAARLLIGSCPKARVIHSDIKYSVIYKQVIVNHPVGEGTPAYAKRKPGIHVEAPLFSQSTRSILGHGIVEHLRHRSINLSIRTIHERDRFCPHLHSIFNQDNGYNEHFKKYQAIGPVLYLGCDRDSWEEVGVGRMRSSDASRISLFTPPQSDSASTEWMKTALSFDRLIASNNAEIDELVSCGLARSRLIKMPMGLSVPKQLVTTADRFTFSVLPLIIAPVFNLSNSCWLDVLNAFSQNPDIYNSHTLLFLCPTDAIQARINQQIANLGDSLGHPISCEALATFSHLTFTALLSKAKLFINTDRRTIDPFLTSIAIALKVPFLTTGSSYAEELVGDCKELLIPGELFLKEQSVLIDIFGKVFRELVKNPSKFQEMGRAVSEFHSEDFEQDNIDIFLSELLGYSL
jgi:glycosyltransferase involved in cell wall biosynthesis